MPSRSLLLLAALTLIALPAFAQDLPTYEQLVAQSQEKLDDVDGWSADITMKITMMGAPITSTGTTFSKGNMNATKMTMDMMGQLMHMNSVLDADGIQWTDFEGMGQHQVVKVDMDKVGADQALAGAMPGIMPGDEMIKDPSQILAQFGAGFEMTVTGESEQNGVPVYDLEGKLKSPEAITEGPLAGMMAGMGEMMTQMGISLEPVFLRVGKEDTFVRSMAMGSVNDVPWMVMEFNNVELNPDFPPGAFTFTAPDGIPVMDMTEMLSQQVQAIEPIAQDETPDFSVGSKAPDFEGETVDGKIVKLSDYRGKIVFVDFWATWCAPCIRELPNLTKTYEAFHDKGFDVLAISLDDEREALDKFLKAHPEMEWTQIYDGAGWESGVAAQYRVEAIPFTLLLDKQGKILATDLRGEALYGSVEAALK